MLMASSAIAVDIKLGVLNDRSGIYADLSGEGSVVAARMAIEDFEAATKGINVEVISADHQNKPDVASTIARQWYDEEGVDLIVDVPTSSAALAVNEITREKGKIFLNSGAASTDLTGAQCAPGTGHWTYDTYALANGTGKAMVESGNKNWYFLTADYAFGHSLEENTTKVVEAAGGTVMGSVRHPFPGTDFSSFLLQAQASGADVIGLANAGGDTVNSIKQAAEFGITQAGQALAGLLIFITDVHALGLETAQGLVLTEAFYWDLNDDTRAWSERFSTEMGGSKPTMVHAGVYSAVTHYLKGVEAAGSKETEVVMDWMKSNPSQDPVFGAGELRADGRHIHDMYLFQVKSPAESTGAWDYYKLLATIPAATAFRPLEDGGCALVE
ncbi:ABC transporter substrate-binding protein [Devosia sp.]|uniref:ABC transporter substrate-binding protein n=1 Tax=Devosia sp. TaxID=1871048 RepID=UPI0025D23619|nr:ABC transporter substrate-binding protein [Devosia sp.]MCR6636690.1 ABC transporter substrate-binding protein [Devosia sp.]